MKKIYAQRNGFVVVGKIKEIRNLLRQYACKFRTVSDMLRGHLN